VIVDQQKPQATWKRDGHRCLDESLRWNAVHACFGDGAKHACKDNSLSVISREGWMTCCLGETQVTRDTANHRFPAIEGEHLSNKAYSMVTRPTTFAIACLREILKK
jgi:hypothetical protein